MDYVIVVTSHSCLTSSPQLGHFSQQNLSYHGNLVAVFDRVLWRLIISCLDSHSPDFCQACQVKELSKCLKVFLMLYPAVHQWQIQEFSWAEKLISQSNTTPWSLVRRGFSADVSSSRWHLLLIGINFALSRSMFPDCFTFTEWSLCSFLYCMSSALGTWPFSGDERRENKVSKQSLNLWGKYFGSLVAVLLSNNSAGQPVSRCMSLCLSQETKKRSKWLQRQLA